MEPAKTGKKGGKKSPNLDMAVRGITVGAFNLTATLTMHEHWLKDAPDVAPITEPICAWLDQLPARQLKAIEERIIPVLLAVGIAEVLIPDIVLEVKLRALHRRSARLEAEGQGSRGPFAPEGGPGLRPEYRHPTANGHGAEGAAGPVGSDDSRPPRIPGFPV